MNLKEAITNNKLLQFVKEHSKEKGDKDKFDEAISSMVHKSKPAPKTAAQDDSDH